MKKNVYLSIIVPCYNGDDVIETAIHSILSQNNDEIEMIIVNDGSRDNTENVIKKYESEQIRYYRTDNLGAGHARNYGISKAVGTWIAFLDSDDIYIEGSMQKVLPALHKYEQEGIEVIYTPRTKGDMQFQNAQVAYAEDIENVCHIPELEFVTCLYRRSFLDKHNIRFFEYKEQDIETAFRFRVFSKLPKVVTDNTLDFYFQRNNPNSNTHTWREDVLHRVKAKVYLELLEENTLKKEDSWLLRITLREVSKYYLTCVKRGCSNVESLKQVNSTYKKARSLGKNVPTDMTKIKFVCISSVLHLLGNTIGRRAFHSR